MHSKLRHLLLFILLTFALPFFVKADSQHVDIRTFMISSHLAQTNDKVIIVAGDSIIESWLDADIGNCNTINAGIGGGTLSDIAKLLNLLNKHEKKSHINGIIIAIGVNDALYKKNKNESLKDWEFRYWEVVSLALRLSDNIYLSTILPVEHGMPLGDKYFDPSQIYEMNNMIRKIARKRNIKLVDLSNKFAEKHYTVDGVHPQASAYKIIYDGLRKSLSAQCGV